MWVLLASMLIGQFEIGDHVYVDPKVPIYLTAETASTRLNGYYRPYDHGKIIAIKEIDGEKFVRFQSTKYEVSPWARMDYVREWDTDAMLKAKEYVDQLEAKRMEAIKTREANKAKYEEESKENQARLKAEAIAAGIRPKLKPYIQTRMELQAMETAFSKGINPLNMSPKEAEKLTPGQRKALSELRRRYQRAG
jgi:hypothetical protein